MDDTRLCSQGHVVEASRETCARCNGSVVGEAPAEALLDEPEQKKSDEVSETSSEASSDAESAKIDETTGAPEGAEVISREEASAQGVDVEKVEAEAEHLDEGAQG